MLRSVLVSSTALIGAETVDPGPNGSMFTYINRANPGSQMIGMFLGFYPFTSSSIIHIDDELASVSGSYVKHPRSLPSGCT
jgi:hypothetical protein